MNKVLVLCTGNSCRSQIAEAYLRHFAGEKAEIYSAGIETHGVNPRAISTMKEDGIDISQHTSNNIEEYVNIDFDFCVLVVPQMVAEEEYRPERSDVRAIPALESAEGVLVVETLIASSLQIFIVAILDDFSHSSRLGFFPSVCGLGELTEGDCILFISGHRGPSPGSFLGL